MKFKTGDCAIVSNTDEEYEYLIGCVVLITDIKRPGYMVDIIEKCENADLIRNARGWYMEEGELSPYTLDNSIEDLL
jgi:hypothetical protein